jgi:hypothetical protein
MLVKFYYVYKTVLYEYEIQCILHVLDPKFPYFTLAQYILQIVKIQIQFQYPILSTWLASHVLPYFLYLLAVVFSICYSYVSYSVYYINRSPLKLIRIVTLGFLLLQPYPRGIYSANIFSPVVRAPK